MEKRTADIIMVLKGNYDHHLKENFGELNSFSKKVAAYMSDTCWCPIEEYTADVLMKIIVHAVIDYMSTCTNKSELVFNYFYNLFYCSDDDFGRWCSALSLVQVMRDGEYINGFTEELIRPYWEVY